MFKKYQHIERFGAPEVQLIELGECFVFPKIDGTNSSVWLDENGNVCAGSRNRELSKEKDNAGFYEWASSDFKIHSYLHKYPDHRLFGEWLVPHSIKTYRDEAWKKFYVFDVAVNKSEDEIKHEGNDSIKYLHYADYAPKLEAYHLDYIHPLAIMENASYDQFVDQLEKNVFLMQDGKGCGEGIVIKNYDFYNKAGNQIWAKIVTSEFKEKHQKTMGSPRVSGKKMIEEQIANKYVTKALCQKVKAKIEVDAGEFGNKHIPRLLNTVYYDVVKEESWNFVKEFKNPVINYKILQHFIFNKAKENLPEVFK